ncbi:hypothetical protein Bca4012_011764 [Brassica carinata]
MVDGNGIHQSTRKTGNIKIGWILRIPRHLVDDCPPTRATRASSRNPTLGIRHEAKHVAFSLPSLHLPILLVWMSHDSE